MRLLLKSLYFNLWEIGRFVLAPANIKETITVVSNQAVKAVSIEEERLLRAPARPFAGY